MKCKITVPDKIMTHHLICENNPNVIFIEL